VSIQITGDKELIAKLNRLSGPEMKAALRKATRAGAKPMLNAARQTAPERTGDLRRATKLRQKTKGNSVTTGVQTKIRYGSFVEFGTRKMKGQHFIEDAADREQSSSLSTCVNEIANQIQELTK
jgi:HK97 gp10 family phage protein